MVPTLINALITKRKEKKGDQLVKLIAKKKIRSFASLKV